MLHARTLTALLVGALMSIVACNALLQIDNYRACAGAECDAGAAADASPDAFTPCSTSADCAAAEAGVVCSQNTCLSVRKLARGMSLFACVVLSDGTARCWGRNAEGQLGHNTVSTQVVAQPQVVLDKFGNAMTNIDDLVTGFGYACAKTLVNGNTDVWCWGMVAAGGFSTTPQQVSLNNNAVTSISGAFGTACAVLGNGDVYCWGENVSGQMTCDNASSCSAPDSGGPSPGLVPLSAPRKLVTPQHYTYFAAGLYASCAGNTGSGFIDCYGSDGWGQLADNASSPDCCGASNPPSDIGASTAAQLAQLEGTDAYMCAKDNSQNWYCWGGNSTAGWSCPILNGCKDLHVPTPLVVGSPILNFSPGWRHGCAITKADVRCWGDNTHGQMGNGTTTPPVVTQPETTQLPVVATDIASHRHFTCAVGVDKQVYCWGQNGDPANDPNPWLLGANSPWNDITTPAVVRWE